MATQQEKENQRGNNWQGREISALINIWGDEEYRHANDDPFTKKKKIMERISSRLAELGYKRSVTQITNKLKLLKSKYKQVLDNNRRSGRARMDWEFFDEVDAILGARPAINPPAGQVIDSNNARRGSRSAHDDSSQDELELDDSTSQESDDASMTSVEGDAELTGISAEDLDEAQHQVDADQVLPNGDEDQPAEPPAPREPAAPANPAHVERRSKNLPLILILKCVSAHCDLKQECNGKKMTKVDKSINIMLKQFIESQESQDKRFVSMEKQRAEDERKRAEREHQIRGDELQLAREQLQEQRRAREAKEAREKRSDDMMQALLLSLTGQSRVAPQTHQQHVRQPYMFEPYVQSDSNGRMPSRSNTPYMPYPATRPDPLVANQSQPRRQDSHNSTRSSDIPSSFSGSSSTHEHLSDTHRSFLNL